MKYLIVVIFLVLFSCGGGGGSSSSIQPQPAAAPTPNPSSSSSGSSDSTSSENLSFKIVITGLNISSSDDLAQLKLNEQTTNNAFNFKNFLAGKVDIFLKGFFPSLYAQVSTVKPIDLSQWEIITKKLVNGSLTDINPIVKVYEIDAEGKFLHRSDSNYLCFYLNSETNELSPNNDKGEKLQELRDANGNVIEKYVLDGTQPQYSNEALSCALNEVETSCDTSNLPIRIVIAREADESGSIIGRIEFAESFQEFENACTPNLTIGQFLIKDSKVYPINDFCVEVGFYGRGTDHDFVLKPNGAFNTTNDIIVNTYAIQPNSSLDCNMGEERYIRSMSINEEDRLIVKQLSPSSFSSSGSTTYKWRKGSVAYNGTNLFVVPSNASDSVFYVFKDDGGFDILRPDIITHTYPIPDGASYPLFLDSNQTRDYSNAQLSHLGHYWFDTYGTAKAFADIGNNINFVFKEDGTLVIFDQGLAHFYDVDTKNLSKVVDDTTWPPEGYSIYAHPDNEDGIFLPVLNNCPTTSSTELSPLPQVIGTRSLPTCMIFPNGRGSNNLNTTNQEADMILGRYKNNVIFFRNGSWHLESFIHSGSLLCLPYRPTCQKGVSSKQYGFFDLADNYMFAVNTDKNLYVRYDMDDHSFKIINLDDYNYIPESYEISKDQIYVEVINANNSNKEYLKIDFATGTESFLGTISEDNRTVIEIEPLNI